MSKIIDGLIKPKRKGNSNSRKENTDIIRFCRICKLSKELNSDNFHKSKSRYLGFEYVCKPCENIRAKNKPKRTNRIYTREQKLNKTIAQLKYQKKLSTAVNRINSYRAIDKKKGIEFNLTVNWYKENIDGKACHYCGDNESKIGCDRIDNKQGHVKLNVIPCCKLCNVTRMDNFTYNEMIILGETIRQIKKLRIHDPRSLLEAGKPYV